MGDVDFFHASINNRFVVTVTVWLTSSVKRESTEAASVEREVRSFLESGMALSMVGPSPNAPFLSLGFRSEHRPNPYEDILAWLQGNSAIRLIEIEHWSAGS